MFDIATNNISLLCSYICSIFFSFSNFYYYSHPGCEVLENAWLAYKKAYVGYNQNY